jgi:hypothetical protein
VTLHRRRSAAARPKPIRPGQRLPIGAFADAMAELIASLGLGPAGLLASEPALRGLDVPKIAAAGLRACQSC